jgi:hypothetical protein
LRHIDPILGKERADGLGIIGDERGGEGGFETADGSEGGGNGESPVVEIGRMLGGGFDMRLHLRRNTGEDALNLRRL